VRTQSENARLIASHLDESENRGVERASWDSGHRWWVAHRKPAIVVTASGFSYTSTAIGYVHGQGVLRERDGKQSGALRITQAEIRAGRANALFPGVFDGAAESCLSYAHAEGDRPVDQRDNRRPQRER
jgi:hypothetical protein